MAEHKLIKEDLNDILIKSIIASDGKKRLYIQYEIQEDILSFHIEKDNKKEIYIYSNLNDAIQKYNELE